VNKRNPKHASHRMKVNFRQGNRILNKAYEEYEKYPNDNVLLANIFLLNKQVNHWKSIINISKNRQAIRRKR
jgi:hypothetical protein